MVPPVAPRSVKMTLPAESMVAPMTADRTALVPTPAAGAAAAAPAKSETVAPSGEILTILPETAAYMVPPYHTMGPGLLKVAAVPVPSASPAVPEVPTKSVPVAGLAVVSYLRTTWLAASETYSEPSAARATPAWVRVARVVGAAVRAAAGVSVAMVEASPVVFTTERIRVWSRTMYWLAAAEATSRETARTIEKTFISQIQSSGPHV